MFIHVVLMSFKPGTGEAFHRRVEAYASEIRQQSPGLANYVYGENESDRSGGFTHAVVACFRDRAAHERYQVSAIHQDMKTFMAVHTERLLAFDSDRWA